MAIVQVINHHCQIHRVHPVNLQTFLLLTTPQVVTAMVTVTEGEVEEVVVAMEEVSAAARLVVAAVVQVVVAATEATQTDATASWSTAVAIMTAAILGVAILMIGVFEANAQLVPLLLPYAPSEIPAFIAVPPSPPLPRTIRRCRHSCSGRYHRASFLCCHTLCQNLYSRLLMQHKSVCSCYVLLPEPDLGHGISSLIYFIFIDSYSIV